MSGSGGAESGWSFVSNDPEPMSRSVPERCLMGDLQTMLLGDLLQWLATRKKSGTLHCRRRSTRKLVVFQEGTLVACSSNDPRETLGQFLLREQLLSEEQLFRALERQQQQAGTLLGVLLLSEGRISADQLQRALRAKAEETLYELFLWGDGGFFFEENKRPRSESIGLELDASAVVLEGNRRRARWRRIQESFPNADVSFKALVDTPPPASAAERRMLELARRGKTLAQISLETRRSEFAVAEYLHALCELKVLAVLAIRRGPDDADTVGALERMLARAERALQELRLDDAFETYQDVLALDPLNRAARQGLVAVSDARKQQRLARQSSPEVPAPR
jgi:hypothetical protein